MPRTSASPLPRQSNHSSKNDILIMFVVVIMIVVVTASENAVNEHFQMRLESHSDVSQRRGRWVSRRSGRCTREGAREAVSPSSMSEPSMSEPSCASTSLLTMPVCHDRPKVHRTPTRKPSSVEEQERKDSGGVE